ncbi:MAG: hypothetical protein FWD66_08235 [Paludibacter sp.]|nr:hypothetical protein [Paludibacter sp.]
MVTNKFCKINICWFLLVSLTLSITSCYKEKNAKAATKEISNDTLQLISESEYIKYWDSFSYALIQNDTSKLSQLIDNDFYGYCSRNLNISEICNFDLDNDTIFSKNRFIKEFIKCLNPIYLELLKMYDIQRDIKPIRTLEQAKNRYHCAKRINKNNYSISTLITSINEQISQYNKIFILNTQTLTISTYGGKNQPYQFILYYYSDDNEIETKCVNLMFRKIKNEIKLSGIDFYYVLSSDE